jgi:hypothetical protein
VCVVDHERIQSSQTLHGFLNHFLGRQQLGQISPGVGQPITLTTQRAQHCIDSVRVSAPVLRMN